jgi:hypothetical protein
MQPKAKQKPTKQKNLYRKDFYVTLKGNILGGVKYSLPYVFYIKI